MPLTCLKTVNQILDRVNTVDNANSLMPGSSVWIHSDEPASFQVGDCLSCGGYLAIPVC